MGDEPPVEDRNAPVGDLSLLSRREREVLDAAQEGLSARAIADRFSLTEATVRSHLSAIYSKLGVAGRVELLARLNGQAARTTATPEPETRSLALGTRGRGRWSSRRVLGLVSLVVSGLVVAVVFAVALAGSPPASDLATVSRLLASNQVARLDLVNSTLTVTEKGGERLRVEGVTLEAFKPVQVVALNASVPVSVSGGTVSPLLIELLITAAPLLEIIALSAVAFVFVRMIRRPWLRSRGQRRL
jgi:DNA-binding CsgD family transcriptional regulator